MSGKRFKLLKVFSFFLPIKTKDIDNTKLVTT